MRGFVDSVKEALAKNNTIVFAGKCTVKYSGRAESFLDESDLLVVMKADKTLVIHQATGNNPVNYMKPGCSYIIKEQEEQVEIHAEHKALKEFMDITVKEVYFINTYKLLEGESISIDGTEKDMADMLYKTPELIERNFKTVSREEQTKYGFIDVLGYDDKGILCVIECKRFTADLKAVDQLRRYVERIKESKGIDRVRGILACPKITPNALQMLHDWGFTHVMVKPPKRYDAFHKLQTKLNNF